MLIKNTRNWARACLRYLACLPILLSVLSLGVLSEGKGTVARTQAAAVDEREVYSFVRSMEIRNPVGLVFMPEFDSFLVLEPFVQAELAADSIEVFLVPPADGPIRSRRIDVAVTDLVNVAFDTKRARLLILDAQRNELLEFQIGSDGLPSSEATAPIGVQQFGLVEPRGMAFDPHSGELVVLDAARGILIRVAPTTDAGLTGVAAWGAGRVSEVDLRVAGLEDMHGLAINPVDGHYFVLSPATGELYELTATGKLLAVWPLAELRLNSPQGMAFGSSADQTDDPARMNLYVVNWLRGKTGRPEPVADHAAADRNAEEDNARLLEIFFVDARLTQASTVEASLVQMIDTSQFTPPSPDPAGITYIAATNSLMISDSEVDEMPIFAGANLFRSTLSGTLLDSYSTIQFSREPNGLAYNPANEHLFVSDDTRKLISEVDPGSDGLYLTADDTVIQFSTRLFQSVNPEDVAYDPEQGHLFVLDQTNREVYEISPGTNGVFDGVSPDGDDYVTSFDIERWGSIRPQGLDFDAATGHLFIVGTPSHQLIELTRAGTFVRLIDIAAASARLPADMTFAPSSTDPTKRSAYIADRGRDNNTHPDENDGKVFEMAWSPPPPDPQLFSVDAGSNQRISWPDNRVAVTGTLAQDRPSAQTGTMETRWDQLKGPDRVSFADATALGTTILFPTHGVYVLRLMVADGELFARDTVTVTVTAVNAPPQVDPGLTQVITLAQTAILHGSVIDDGLPDPPAVTSHWWSVHYGQAEAVTIGDPTALDTTVRFSRPGTYILRLTADDGQLSGVGDVTIVVLEPGGHSLFIPHISHR